MNNLALSQRHPTPAAGFRREPFEWRHRNTMDPNATLKILRDLFRPNLPHADEWNTVDDIHAWASQVDDAWGDLDGWLSNGGFLPTVWSRVGRVDPDQAREQANLAELIAAAVTVVEEAERRPPNNLALPRRLAAAVRDIDPTAVTGDPNRKQHEANCSNHGAFSTIEDPNGCPECADERAYMEKIETEEGGRHG